MSTNESKDTEANGHVAPEDARLRLKKLHEYVTFLANLARLRQSNEGKEWTADIRPRELAICLEQLEQQIAQVMEGLSWPDERRTKATASEANANANAEACKAEDGGVPDTDAEAAEIIDRATGKRYLSGITLEQIDEINLLLSNLHAVGNVVCCADHAEYSVATLAVMGDAIYRDVDKIHDIVDTIYESQRFFGPKYTLNSVREAQASYLALQASLPMSGAGSLAYPAPTYQ
jgi:hypothetical protein